MAVGWYGQPNSRSGKMFLEAGRQKRVISGVLVSTEVRGGRDINGRKSIYIYELWKNIS